MRSRIIACAVVAGTLIGGTIGQSVDAKSDDATHRQQKHHDNAVFAEGGPIAGSANGISFDSEDNLWIASVFGQTLTKVDPDTGEILDQLGSGDTVYFPDDVVVDRSDDTLYWTDIALGTVLKKPVGEPAQFLLPPFGLNSANPVTLSDDGARLFAAGCYGGPPGNSFVEIDPVNGGIVNTLLSDVPGCASNGMAWRDGFLYAPQALGDSVLKINATTGASGEVTTGYANPVGVAFDSEGALYAVSQGTGEVVRIDLTNTNTATNREVITTFPVGWVDNLAFDSNDRLFVSSASDGGVVEVDVDDGSVRTVVEGQFTLPLGIVVLGDTLYTVNPQQLLGFDRKSGEQTSIIRSVAGVGPFNFPTLVSEWNDQLVLTSAIAGGLTVWDPATQAITYETQLAAPGDAIEFQGDLIVNDTGTGNVLRLDGDDLSVSTVIANVPGGTGLAATKKDLYIADATTGTVLQLVDRGKTLATPEVVVSDLATPEGIDIRGNKLYVAETGIQSLTEISLRSGKRRTIATDLGFMTGIPGSVPLGWFNDVTIDRNDIYVGADRANVIYDFQVGGRDR